MAPRTERQFNEIREEKRSLIMDTALMQFAREGFHFTTISDIAKHAGISKGLMYNYFRSKEELLSAIIKRSVVDIYQNLDPNRDGILSEDEFELFVRQLADLLIKKRTIWMLLFQMMMQNEVREVFVRDFQNSVSLNIKENRIDDLQVINHVTTLFNDYFERKRTRRPEGYDPATELSMFMMTMKGFAVTFVYSEISDESLFNETVNKIIEYYK